MHNRRQFTSESRYPRSAAHAGLQHPAMHPSLLKAYRKTDYQVACCVIHIGRQAPAIDRLLISHRAREAALITAYNPFSRRRPLGWNRRMQSRLTQAARRHTMLPAKGVWRRWSEDHLLLIAKHRQTLCLARRFRTTRNCEHANQATSPCVIHLLMSWQRLKAPSRHSAWLRETGWRHLDQPGVK